MKAKFALVSLLLVIVMSSCNLSAVSMPPTSIPPEQPTLVFPQPTEVPPASPTAIPTTTIAAAPTSVTRLPIAISAAGQSIFDRATAVITALQNIDMTALASYVHPEQGLRFSPYAYVKDTDLVFPKDKVAGLIADETVYSWGAYDGSGLPIELNFADYYSKFVYDMDFANAPQISLNHRLGEGNSIDNSLDFYPGAAVVEYYYPGSDPNYQGMDWESLRLVFMQENNVWYLVGIIHDQWTI